ncbi:hypothetical protein [Spiroplasma ixodetis]|uniref:hypothetical protein n=1 Tax=Spiroplasma ixodetis TaxID=2141 RepID=UPI00257894ED|nr:hypothetical protein [Spiroplasma ixodetis]WJG70901.1 hypothetical protein SIXOD_v1c21890 [Spiroplasma ixodetis Y32]
MQNKYLNIDGKTLNKILNTDYKKDVLRRLQYANTIVIETDKKLFGTNFENLLEIIVQTCDQIKGWINEYKIEISLKEGNFDNE